MYTLGTIREFRTANFRVIVDAVEEDSPDLSWDDSGEVLAKLNSGEYIIFCARARVIHDEMGEIASDYLGNCIHESLESFQDHKLCGAANRKLREQGSKARCGSYFHAMIREVCTKARRRLVEMRKNLAGLTIREYA